MQEHQGASANRHKNSDEKQFYISESSDSSSDHENNYDSEDDSQLDARFSSGEKPRSRLSSRTFEESDDSPLLSLEDGFQHGITTQRIMTQYLDHSLDALLLARSGKKGKRHTIKTAASQLSTPTNTPTRKGPILHMPHREISFSTGNLSNLSSESPHSTPTHSLSPLTSPLIFPNTGLPPLAPRDNTNTEENAIDRKEHRRRKRTKDLSRHWDRDHKHHGHKGSSTSPPTMEQGYPYHREKKLSCVRSSSSSHPRGEHPAQHHWQIPVFDCPPDRINFFKAFISKVRSYYRDKQRGDKAYNRMISDEDSIHYETIFLELRAWRNGLLIYEEDKILFEKRQAIPFIIEEVLKFNVQVAILKSKSAPDLNKDKQYLGIPSQPQRKISNENDILTIQSIVESIERGGLEATETTESPDQDQDQLEEICGCSESLNRLCQDCIIKETETLKCVENLMQKVEEMEHLYPSTKALGSEHPSYNSPEFAARIKSLNLWLNFMHTMRQKIDLLAKLFGLKNRAQIGWPDYDSCCNEKSQEQIPTVTPGKTFPPKLKLLQCGNNIVDSSPTTSSSDASDKWRGSGPASPEVQQTSPFDTSNSSASSGYHSALQYSIINGDSSGVQIYRKYVDKTLKHKGLKNICAQLFTIFRPILQRVHQTLKQPKNGSSANVASKVIPVMNECQHVNKESDSLSLSSASSTGHTEKEDSFGIWSEPFQSMGLPTFHRPFFFLLRVPLDVVHACIKLRLQQQPDEPSELSIGQIMKECKEVLKAGVQIRQRYVNFAQTVLGNSGTEVVEGQLESFDEDLKLTLQAYLRYLEQRMQFMQRLAQFTTFTQKSLLEEEWVFVRQHCPHIPGGEALAANKFCFMASDLLGSIGHHLESGIDDCFMEFSESTSSEVEGFSTYKKVIQESFRKFHRVFKDTSERARQGIAFAKTLRKDLEIATEFKNLVSASELMIKLSETGHIRVIAPHSRSHVMFVPGYLRHNEPYIWMLVDMTCGHESPETLTPEQEGYLILMRCEVSDAWSGPTLILEPTAEATITLSHVEVDGVLLVVNHSSQLMNQCRRFQRVMGSTLQVDKQQTSCNHAIAEALNDLKTEALGLREKMCTVLCQVEEKLVFDQDSQQTEDWASLQSRGTEVLHQGYNMNFEYQKALSRLITGEGKKVLGLGMIRFAKQWMNFISKRCDLEKGVRPRWTKQGMDFMITASEPQYIQLLSDSEFMEWKLCIKDCSSRVLNDHNTTDGRQLTSPTHGTTQSRLSFSGPGWHRSPSAHSRSESTPSTPPTFPHSNTSSGQPDMEFNFRRSSKEEPGGSGVSSANLSEEDLYTIATQLTEKGEVLPIERVHKAVKKLEENRQQRLQKRNVVGHVIEHVVNQMPVHISARRVNFTWQRGNKIGEGRFGKVYTAVNNETGELIAMKEIRLQPNDHRAIKEALDEIRTFEGIKHPNLVRYYGVEILRDEMLIFMEYCNDGSLESMAQLQLPETLIRKYTRQLMEALNVLHEHAIVHRDIKSANIFLLSDGTLKLGDFGCCIKLKNHTTLPGELHKFVGTPAYMAPEVFTRNNSVGHGRAADIWSVGCVVYEMATGKRPWHELDSSYQIMFKVGTGESLEIPESLSQEGQDFLSHCLQNDPADRWTASQLLDHPFTKVSEEEYS